MKFKEKTEYVFKSINNSFNIERMLLNHVEVNEFKQAIEIGLDDYDKRLEHELDNKFPKIITLNSDRLEKVKEGLCDINNWYYEDCDCGDWIVHIENLGYFTLTTYCRKSNFCDIDKLWDFDTDVYIYDKNVFEEEYDWDNINTECKIDKNQVNELICIANETIRKLRGWNEYGERLKKKI